MRQADYARKFDAAVAEINNAGVRGWNGVPPSLRLSRKMGFKQRPPYYVPFGKMAVSSAIYFAVTWGVFMHLVQWRAQAVSISGQVLISTLAGLAFGLSMALWYRFVRRKNRLSSWDDL